MKMQKKCAFQSDTAWFDGSASEEETACVAADVTGREVKTALRWVWISRQDTEPKLAILELPTDILGFCYATIPVIPGIISWCFFHNML